MRTSLLLLLLLLPSSSSSRSTSLPTPAAASSPPYPFNNASLPTAQRVADLLSRMTLHEKVGQMFMDRDMAWGHDAPPKGDVDEASTAIDRLGVPEFIFMGQGNVYRGASNGCIVNCCSCYDGKNMSNCCHDGAATQFPQGTGVAATWNMTLIHDMGRIAADESRGMMHFPGKRKAADYRTGASSVINILRDGRWGRAPETYGECPVLTGDVAVAFNKGLSGFLNVTSTEREYGDRFKVLGNVRHFVAYAGPDSQRFHFNAQVSDDDLRLTYLPAWKRLSDAGALGGVMSAISGLNGIPSVVHKYMLTDTLRGEWGFDGHVISDCDTLGAVEAQFHWTSCLQQSVAQSVLAGNDLNCGPEFASLTNATKSGFISEEEIDVSVARLLRRRVQIGDLDIPASADPYASIPYSVVDSPAHQAVARQIVAESTVILHNGLVASSHDGSPSGPLLKRSTEEGTEEEEQAPQRVLPLARGVGRIAVIGPSADDLRVQAHTYHGTPSKWITVFDGLKEVAGGGTTFTFTEGCSRTKSGSGLNISGAVAAAQNADVVIFVGGLEASMEEEGTDRINSIALPGDQMKVVEALQGVGKPMVVITISGGPVAEPVLATAPNLAWVWVSYFGQDGRGISDVLFGDVPASGALPFTVPLHVAQLGSIVDYSMTAPPFGKTYRYLRLLNESATPLYPFGFGLSIVDLQFTKLVLTGQAPCSTGSDGGGACASPSNDLVTAVVTVTNNDKLRAGAKVVALYGSFRDANGGASQVRSLPIRQLLAHDKVHVPAGGSVEVTLQFHLKAIAGAMRQPFPGILQCWVGSGMAANEGTGATEAVGRFGSSHYGSPGEGTVPRFGNLTLVL